MNNTTYRVFGVIALVAVVIALIFTGTQVMAGKNTSDQPNLAGSSWNLTEWTENGTTSQIVPGSKPNLEFDNEGGLHGTSGCNIFNGSFEINGQDLSVGQLMQTLMACDEATMQQEYSFGKLLTDAKSYSITGDTLTIVSDNGSLTFVRA